MPLHETPLGPLAPGWTLRPGRRCATGCASWTSSSRWPAATCAPACPPRRAAARPGPAAAPPPARRTTRWRRTPTGWRRRRSATSRCAATCPARVDAVLRLQTEAGPRFVVVDYKTNRLGDPARPLTAADYAPPLLAEAMLHSHYPLQAMLYCVVAHRYLRWRLPGYDPEVHLGGVLYLYVRGMCGPDTPTVDGLPVGRLRLAPARGAGHRPVRPARRRARGGVMIERFEVRGPLRRPAGDRCHRAAADLQPRRGDHRRRRPRRHPARRADRRPPTRRSASPLALAVRAARHGLGLRRPRGRRGTRRPPTPTRRPAPASPTCSRGPRSRAGWPASRPAPPRRPRWCRSSTACSTSTATGARRARSATTC